MQPEPNKHTTKLASNRSKQVVAGPYLNPTYCNHQPQPHLIINNMQVFVDTLVS